MKLGLALRCAVVLAVGAGARSVAGDALPELPGPAPRARRDPDVAAANAACAGCHVDEAREWRGSLHQRAYTDPVFAAAYRLEPLAFCRGCHAPEADPRAPPEPALREVGVGCVTCHLEGDRVVGVGPASRAAPHGVFADARLGTERACAGCHEFDFPELPVAMQSTVTEHEDSPHRNEPCASCHMERVAGAGRPRRRHDFSVVGRPELLQRAVVATATRAGETSIRVAVRATGAGHAVPTGDMFRRLELVAFAAVGGVEIESAPVTLARRFAFRSARDPGQSPVRIPVGDDRVPASGVPREALLVFATSIDRAPVRWEVRYARMGPALAAKLGVDREAVRVVIASGTLPAPSSQPSRPPVPVRGSP